MMDERLFMEILQAREDRRFKQADLLKDHGGSLISFTLNTPGTVKDNEMYREIHRLGMEAIINLLLEHGIEIVHQEAIDKVTGSEGYILVDFDPIEVKKLLVKLEEGHFLGRLFDIDVFDRNHRQISRTSLNLSPRKCLICNKPAKICIRERNHTYEELISNVESLWSDYKTD